MSPVKEVLELRLKPQQVATIMARIQRRTRKIVECAQIDLGDVSSVSSDLAQATAEADACVPNRARADRSDTER